MVQLEIRRTIDEIIARYQLEPDLRDVFVEGDSDKRILDWYCWRSGISTIAVYNIATIEAPDALPEAEVGSGNRTRVIQIASIIDESFDYDIDNVKFLIDQDCDTLNGDVVENRYLWVTDFSCMESYFFHSENIGKIMALYFNISDKRDFCAFFEIALKSIFLFRASKMTVCESLPMHNKWPKFLQATDEGIRFDVAGYLNRFLIARGMAEIAEKIEESYQRLWKVATRDIRNYIHGHCLVLVLCWYARQRGVVQKVCDPDLVHRALYVSAEHEHFREYPLFAGLRSWAASVVR